MFKKSIGKYQPNFINADSKKIVDTCQYRLIGTSLITTENQFWSHCMIEKSYILKSH